MIFAVEQRGEMMYRYDPYTDKFIKDVPNTNVGKWILLGCGWARCSQCGVKHINIYDDGHWYNFCPHCGAKMEGVKLSVPLSIFTRTVKYGTGE